MENQLSPLLTENIYVSLVAHLRRLRGNLLKSGPHLYVNNLNTTVHWREGERVREREREIKRERREIERERERGREREKER